MASPGMSLKQASVNGPASLSLENDISVVPQLQCCVLRKRLKYDLHAFAPDELERGHEVRIPCDDDYGADHFSKREARHVHTNSHINSLLANVKKEVIVRKRAMLPNKLLRLAWFHLPYMWSNADLAQSEGKMRFQNKLIVQTLCTAEPVCVAQVIGGVRYRTAHLLSKRGRIVVINAKKFVVSDQRQLAEPITLRDDIVDCWMPAEAVVQFLGQISAIQQNGVQ